MNRSFKLKFSDNKITNFDTINYTHFINFPQSFINPLRNTFKLTFDILVQLKDFLQNFGE